MSFKKFGMALDKNLFSKIMIGFGFVMVVVFIGLGLFLILSPKYYWLQNTRYIVGFFFIAYGLFRVARIINSIREQKRREYYDE